MSRITVSVFPDLDTIASTYQTTQGGEPLLGIRVGDVWISPGHGPVTDFAAALRRVADELDHAYRVWLDENAETWGRDENGYFRDCGGFGEHTDTCPVGDAIRAARHSLARAGVLRDLGPGVEAVGDICEMCTGIGTVLDSNNDDRPIACPQCRTDDHVAARAQRITQAAS